MNADLARSLQLVATGGADEFYRGDLARRMVQGLEAGGGLFTVADFAGHQAEVYEPLTTTYRDHTVYQTRPPSQGFLLLEMLNLVEGFNLTPLGPNSAEAIHLMVEAKKIAYADRNRVAGDPRFVDWPLDELIAKAYADERRSDIHRDRVNVALAGLQPARWMAIRHIFASPTALAIVYRGFTACPMPLVRATSPLAPVSCLTTGPGAVLV